MRTLRLALSSVLKLVAWATALHAFQLPVALCCCIYVQTLTLIDAEQRVSVFWILFPSPGGTGAHAAPVCLCERKTLVGAPRNALVRGNELLKPRFYARLLASPLSAAIIVDHVEALAFRAR